MSFLSHRRALVLAGLTGMILSGGAVAVSTAAYAHDTSNATAETITDAVKAAEAKYPDCETTTAVFDDSAEHPVWNVELDCDSGTVKYATVDAETGEVTDDGDRVDEPDATGGDDTTADTGDAPGTGANTDYS